MDCKNSIRAEFKHFLKHSLSELKTQLERNKPIHWIISLVLIAVGIYVGHKLGEKNIWIGLRYQIYQQFLEKITPRPPHPQRTVVVQIGDKEFWEGPLDRRSPLKRDYLANLLLKLDEANPEVVALDVGLNPPSPEQYKAETQYLLEAIRKVSQNRTVVLSRAIRYTDSSKQEYESAPTIYDQYKIHFDQKRVREGYTSLPYDIRRIPLAMLLKDNSEHDSFALAIVDAVDKKCLNETRMSEKNALPFGTFIPPWEFPTLSASEVLEASPAELKEYVGFKIVIIGGVWHRDGVNQGDLVDQHLSPVGKISGVFIHANYVEALLDRRVYNPMNENLALIPEIIVSIILALILSLNLRLPVKLLIALMLCLILISLSYFLWQNLGIFFEFFIPVVLLVGHVFVERMIGKH